MTSIRSFAFAALVSAVGVGSAMASTTWTISTLATGYEYGNKTTDDLTVSESNSTIGGWANTSGTGSSVDSYTLQDQNTSTTRLVVYDGGLGIGNKDACGSVSYCDAGEPTEPEHAIDNNERYEMALIGFGGTQVRLTSANLGYVKTDSDLTVLRYTGPATTTPPTPPTSTTWAGLIGSGWEWVGHYAGGTATGSRTINASNLYSSYWLVGAFNPLVNNVGSTFGGADIGNDYIKLKSITGCVQGSTATDCTIISPPPPGVPEPGSLALLAGALLGMVGLRRRISA